jgi:hypothetical protein
MKITTINLLLLTLCLAPFTKTEPCNLNEPNCASCDVTGTFCTSCDPGSAKLTTSGCTECNRGEYSPGGAVTQPCTLCPKGKTTAAVASKLEAECTLNCHISCYNCRIQTDQTSCVSCNANQKLSATAPASCVICEPGKFSPDANAATTCQDCSSECKTC